MIWNNSSSTSSREMGNIAIRAETATVKAFFGASSGRLGVGREFQATSQAFHVDLSSVDGTSQ